MQLFLLGGKTVALIGVGEIARKTIKICKYGFDMHCIGWSRSLTKEKAEERVHAQKEDKFYIEASDHIIINSGSVEDFSKDVEKIEKILFN